MGSIEHASAMPAPTLFRGSKDASTRRFAMPQRKLHGEDMLTEAGRAEWGARNARASALATSPYKKDFPLLSRNRELAFLDSAATAQRPKAVLEAQKRFYEKMNANALRGLYRLSVEATEAIGASRARRALPRARWAQRCARHRVLPQHVRGVEPSCFLVCAHGARTWRRGVHHRHGASFQPHSLAAGMPDRRREAGVSVP